MLTFDLVNKKRSSFKVYAITGIITSILLLVLIGLLGDKMHDSLNKALMGLSALGLVTGIFVLSYSIKFKNIIGHISFSKEQIEIELLQRKEIINKENIRNISFELVGFEGLNKTFTPHGFYDLSYHSGINNFVHIQTSNEIRKFEFYISNRKNWDDLKSLVNYYQENINDVNNKA